MSVGDLIPGVAPAKLAIAGWVAGGLVVLLASAATWFVLVGRHQVEHQVEISQAHDQRDAAAANTRVSVAIGQAADAHAHTATRLNQEASDAHRSIDHAPAPAAGLAGASTRIDPALGRLIVCRLNRLRVRPEDATPCATDGADNAPR